MKGTGWVWIGSGLLLLTMAGAGGYAVYSHYKQRGIRNNNPGNLRPSYDAKGREIKWQGQVGHDTGINGPYLIFRTPEEGIRALYRNLMTYRSKYGITTVRGIITRWAPKADKNDTDAYIAAVVKAVGKGADVPLQLNEYLPVVRQIIRVENGIQPYPDELIAKGIALA